MKVLCLCGLVVYTLQVRIVVPCCHSPEYHNTLQSSRQMFNRKTNKWITENFSEVLKKA